MTYVPSLGTAGGWTAQAIAGHYGGDVSFIQGGGDGGKFCTWAFDNLRPGTYRVSATWSVHPNRATNAPYTISGGASPLTVRVNQQAAPADFSEAGVGWKDLTLYAHAGGTLRVVLSNDANGYVIADAVRIERR